MVTIMGEKPPQQALPSTAHIKWKKLDPNNNRKEETTLAWLHIGYTILTHYFILKDEPHPKCPWETSTL